MQTLNDQQLSKHKLITGMEKVHKTTLKKIRTILWQTNAKWYKLLQLYELNYMKLIVIIVLIESKEVLLKMIMWKPGKAILILQVQETSKKSLRNFVV